MCASNLRTQHMEVTLTSLLHHRCPWSPSGRCSIFHIPKQIKKNYIFSAFLWRLKRFSFHGWSHHFSFSASNGKKIALFVDPFGNTPLWAIQVYGVQHITGYSPWQAQCSSGSSYPWRCWLVEDRWSVLCWF